MNNLLSDFYITEVKCDLETGLVTELKIFWVTHNQPGEAFWTSREQVMGVITDGYSVEMLAPAGAAVGKRRLVRVVEVGGKTYLRVDCEPAAGDWLGNAD